MSTQLVRHSLTGANVPYHDELVKATGKQHPPLLVPAQGTHAVCTTHRRETTSTQTRPPLSPAPPLTLVPPQGGHVCVAIFLEVEDVDLAAVVGHKGIAALCVELACCAPGGRLIGAHPPTCSGDMDRLCTQLFYDTFLYPR